MPLGGVKAADGLDEAEAGSADVDILFRRYARELNAFAFGRLRDREAAADVVQDGYERFLRWSREKGPQQGAASPRHFLWTVVSNLTLDLIRRRGRNVVQPMSEADLDVADPVPSAQQRLEAKEQYAIVKATLDALPARHCKALLMSRLEGRTHEEIARRLGVSRSMVSKYIMSALEACLLGLAAAGH